MNREPGVNTMNYWAWPPNQKPKPNGVGEPEFRNETAQCFSSSPFYLLPGTSQKTETSVGSLDPGRQVSGWEPHRLFLPSS